MFDRLLYRSAHAHHFFIATYSLSIVLRLPNILFIWWSFLRPIHLSSLSLFPPISIQAQIRSLSGPLPITSCFHHFITRFIYSTFGLICVWEYACYLSYVHGFRIGVNVLSLSLSSFESSASMFNFIGVWTEQTSVNSVSVDTSFSFFVMRLAL